MSLAQIFWPLKTTKHFWDWATTWSLSHMPVCMCMCVPEDLSTEANIMVGIWWHSRCRPGLLFSWQSIWNIPQYLPPPLVVWNSFHSKKSTQITRMHVTWSLILEPVVFVPNFLLSLAIWLIIHENEDKQKGRQETTLLLLCNLGLWGWQRTFCTTMIYYYHYC